MSLSPAELKKRASKLTKVTLVEILKDSSIRYDEDPSLHLTKITLVNTVADNLHTHGSHCPECRNAGQSHPFPGSVELETCSTCRGLGMVLPGAQPPEKTVRTVSPDECDECEGVGEYNLATDPLDLETFERVKCEQCNGTGS